MRLSRIVLFSGISFAIALLIIGGFSYFNKNIGATVLMVPQGGTGAQTFAAGQCLVGAGTGAVTTGACGTGGGTHPVTSTEPVMAQYFVATSTLATSTFAWGIQATNFNLTSTTATSTASNGINLSNGCFAINGTCVGANGGANVVDTLYATLGAGNDAGGLNIFDVGRLTAASFNATSTTATSSAVNFYGSLIGANYFESTSTLASQFKYASSTSFSATTALIGTLSLTNTLTVPNGGTGAITITGLVKGNAAAAMSAYTGATCINQFIRSLDVSGAPTCATVGTADISLANLTALNTTLTFSVTYNGSAAATIALNLGNANTWTALQQFGNATSTLLTATRGWFTNASSTNLSSDWGGFITASSTYMTIGYSLDAGGAATFEIPNGATPVFSAIGQIGFDTTDNQLLVGTSTVNDPAVFPSRIKLFGGGISSTSPDFVNGGVIPTSQQLDGFIVDQISCQTDGGTSVVINFSNVAGTSDSNTVTCDADGQNITVSANRAYAANSYNRIEIGAITGAVDYMTYSVWGFILRE